MCSVCHRGGWLTPTRSTAADRRVPAKHARRRTAARRCRSAGAPGSGPARWPCRRARWSPRGPPATAATRASSDPPGGGQRDADQRDHGEVDQQAVEVAGALVAEDDGEGALARRRVSVGMSRRLLATRIAQARAPTPTAAYSAGELEASRSGRTSCRAPRPGRRRRRPSPRRGRGSRRAASRRCRTRPRGCASSPTADQPPGGRRGEHQADRPRRRRRRVNAAVFTARGRGDPAADQPQRADPVVVGAADAVGVVVGVVHADLQQQRRRPARAAPSTRPPRRSHTAIAGAGEHRRDGGRQGARSRAGDPLAGWPWAGLAMPRIRVRARFARREQPASRLRHRRGDPRPAPRVGRRRRSRAAGDRDLGLDRASRSGWCSRATRCAPRRCATQERLGGPGQWVLNLPPTYVAGVQVLYRSVVAGTEPVVRRSSSLTGDARTYVSLVPTQLVRRCSATVPSDAGRASTRCWSAAARSRPSVRREAEARGHPDRADLRDERDLRRLRVRRPCRSTASRCGSTTARCSCAGRCCSTATRTSPARTAAAMQDGWFLTDDLGRARRRRPAAGRPGGATT